MSQKSQKFRVEVSEDLHRALKLSADLRRQDLRDYAAPHLWRAVDPRIKALLAEESGGPRSPQNGEICDIPKPSMEKHHRTRPSGPQDSRPPTSEDSVTCAKAYILRELEAGREPPVAEVAEAVGIDSRPLGRLMKAEGMEARNVRRGGKMARRYTLDMLQDFKKLGL